MTKLQAKAGILVLCVVCLTLRSAAQDIPGWTLVWADEFSQPDGSSPDTVSKWTFETGGNGFGNNELEYYTTRTNNARIEDGKLVIEAKQESYMGRNYTSARLKTQGKVSWTYGRMEARIKIPYGQGIWPAFWMLGNNIGSVGWPTCGEIDIMENIGKEPTLVHGTIHGPGYSGGNGVGGPYSLPGNAPFADDFHVYAVEWETNHIQWSVDGVSYFSVTSRSIPEGTTWVFTQPQFILLNLAVGGQWPGNPDGTTVFPQRMTVDYVRVYKATNGVVPPDDVPACGNVLPNPGFEDGGFLDWTTYGANNYVENNYPVHGGSYVYKVFGQFTGSQNDTGVRHDTDTVAGATYVADGWAYTPSNDKIAGANSAWLEVSFRDVGQNVLSLYRSATVTAASPGSVWLNLAVTNKINPSTFAVIGSVSNLVAPDETAFVRYQTVFRQPQNAAGAVLFDDLNLSLAGGEAPIPVLAKKEGDSLAMSFSTYPGFYYEVRFKDALTDSQWQVLETVPGDGQTNTVADVVGADRRFYQVMRICD